MVHEPDFDVTPADGLHHGRVVRVEAHVVRLQALEPGAHPLLTEEVDRRAEEGLERRVRRRDSDLALPCRVRQAPDGSRELARLQLVRVVDEDTRAAAGADPATARGRETGRNLADGRLRQTCEQPAGAHKAERARLLRPVHVGGAVPALLHERGRECGRRCVPDVELDAGRPREPIHDRLDERLLAARVDRERAALGRRRRGADARQEREQQKRAQRCNSLLHVRTSTDQCRLISKVRLTLQQTSSAQCRTCTRPSCTRIKTRAPSGTTSFDGRWETSSMPSRSTR